MLGKALFITVYTETATFVTHKMFASSLSHWFDTTLHHDHYTMIALYNELSNNDVGPSAVQWDNKETSAQKH